MATKCPKCADGLVIIRSTARRTEPQKYFPNGKPLGEIRRYRYCNKCDYSIRTTHKLNKDGTEKIPL
jgi:hypothetical protein